MSPLCGFWSLWAECDRRCLEREELSLPKLRYLMFSPFFVQLGFLGEINLGVFLDCLLFFAFDPVHMLCVCMGFAPSGSSVNIYICMYPLSNIVIY